VLKRTPALHQPLAQLHLQPSDLEDNSDDDDDTVQDMHVGPSRPRITEDDKSNSDDQLSPYVTVRLALARAKAMAKYREVWG